MRAITQLLTRRRGEYILRVGARPKLLALYTNKPLEDVQEWIGNPLPSQDVERMIKNLQKAVEDIGGKVSQAVNRIQLLERSFFLALRAV